MMDDQTYAQCVESTDGIFKEVRAERDAVVQWLLSAADDSEDHPVIARLFRLEAKAISKGLHRI